MHLPKQLMKSAAILVGLLTVTSHASELPKLTAYTYSSFVSEWGPGPQLKKAFEAECQCHIDFVAFDDGVTLFNRLRLEGESTQADLIIGLDNNLLKTAESTQLFAKNNLDLDQLNLPTPWDWLSFVPYDYGQYAFIYDKNRLKKPPKSLKELVNRKDISVIYQDPRTSTVGRGMLAWMNAVYSGETENAWKALAAHTVTVGKGWSETYGAFLKGEADMVLSYNTSPLYHQIHENKDHYVAAEFDEGHIVQIELAARLKTSKHPELAEKFLSFLLTKPAQKILALTNIMLPVIKGEVEPHFDAFKPSKTLAIPMPEKDTAKTQINIWQQAVSH